MFKKTSIDMVYTVDMGYTVEMVYTIGWDGWVTPLLDCYELENIAHDWRRVFLEFVSWMARLGWDHTL